jgi:hypothetical protein
MEINKKSEKKNGKNGKVKMVKLASRPGCFTPEGKKRRYQTDKGVEDALENPA